MSLHNHYWIYGLVLLALTGLACSSPLRERRFSILPPTSEEKLCQEDRRFYYSPAFHFCFLLNSPAWQKQLDSSLPYAILGTNITAIDFSLPAADQKTYVLFTLYINALSQTNIEHFKQLQIELVYQGGGEIIGVAKKDRAQIPLELQTDYDLIDAMLTDIRIFEQ